MPQLECDAITSQTIETTQSTLGCTPEVANLSDSELPEEQFLLLVLDALNRLGIGGTLADYVPCDGAEVARLAYCAVYNKITPGMQNPPAKIKAAILWMLNQALCD